MAIVGVHRPNPQQQQVKQKDPAWMDVALDRVLKGVQIAEGTYGIYSNFKNTQIAEDELIAKQARTTQEYEANFAKEFRKDQRTQRIVNSYDAAVGAEALLKDPNATEGSMRIALLKAFRASGEGGQLTQEALEAITPDQGLRSQILRAFNRLQTGRPLETDKKQLRRMVETLRSHQAERMKVHAFNFAEGEGRRIGIPDYVVNQVLRPRSMLTGEAAARPLTNRGTASKSVTPEGQELKGEARVRYNLDLPQKGSVQTEDAIERYKAGKVDKGVTPARVQAAMESSKGELSFGQAILYVEEKVKALQFRRKQKELMDRNNQNIQKLPEKQQSPIPQQPQQQPVPQFGN